jgi:Sigma-70, region 4
MSGSTSGRSCPGRPRTTDVSVVDEPTQRLDEGAQRALVPSVLAGLVGRRRGARHRREEATYAEPRPAATGEGDDTLFPCFCCCRSGLAPASQVALTLRAIGGLTTREIADAFYVPEATMAQRISRAKRALIGPPARRLDQPDRRRPARSGDRCRIGPIARRLNRTPASSSR